MRKEKKSWWEKPKRVKAAEISSSPRLCRWSVHKSILTENFTRPLEKVGNMLGWIKKKIFGTKNVIWEDTRGNVTQRYTFHPVKIEIEGKKPRASCVCYSDSSAKIDYHLMQYSGDWSYIALFLIEDTIHELSHWADEGNYWKDNDHWVPWREAIYREIDYVKDEWDIEVYHQ